jgi:drug/metabolite transporter (DMT)-like permease
VDNKQKTLSQSRGLLLVIIATVCWATSGLFINWVVQDSGISPRGLAFWRDIGTFTCLFTGLLLFRPALLRIHRRDLPWLAAMGAISIGSFHVLWNMAVLYAGVSIATVLQSNAPIFVALAAWLLWREPLTRRKSMAIVLAFMGTVLIARLDDLGGAQITLTGFLAGLVAAINYSTLSLFGKKLTGNYSPWTVLTYAFGFGALVLLPFQYGLAKPWPVAPTVLAAYAGLVFLPTIGGFALYTTALRNLPASVAAIAATMEIPFAALASYLVLGERLDTWQILGAILVASGVILLSAPRRPWPVLALWRKFYRI